MPENRRGLKARWWKRLVSRTQRGRTACVPSVCTGTGGGVPLCTSLSGALPTVSEAPQRISPATLLVGENAEVGTILARRGPRARDAAAPGGLAERVFWCEKS